MGCIQFPPGVCSCFHNLICIDCDFLNSIPVSVSMYVVPRSSNTMVLLRKSLKRCCRTASQKCEPESFSSSKLGNFFQEQPVISNPFLSDKFLQRCLRSLLPKNVSQLVCRLIFLSCVIEINFTLLYCCNIVL